MCCSMGSTTWQCSPGDTDRLSRFYTEVFDAPSAHVVEQQPGVKLSLIDIGNFVTDFGPYLSLFFVDPDGLEGEVLVANPEAEAGVFNPPGTRAGRYT